ncbi:iron ABC transporter substrate-binding protein [Halobacteriales archaeon QS_5_70_15]|nr:MAG: iron ABC transporter substrate-binding protein [Halobacteriales archaeon QS_5_70_15]
MSRETRDEGEPQPSSRLGSPKSNMQRDGSPEPTRRRLLALAGSAGAAALAGCSGSQSPSTPSESPTGTDAEGDSGDGTGRPAPGGTPMSEMPDLSGTVDVYSGRGEALVGALVEYIEDLYPDLTLRVSYGGSTDLVNTILTEGNNSPADVFYSVNAGSLGALAGRDRAAELPDDVLGLVREEFRDPDGGWVGTSGRARTVPYNTDAFSESEIPEDVFAFPEQDRFEDEMGWAPSYGSFQAFVTAMRILNDRETTREWLEGMLDLGIQSYSDEFAISQAIADGEISAGFANHYYIQRVLDGRPDAPLATAFTEGDAGSVFNVAGAAVVDTTDDPETAANFVRHLLSAEAQEYFATTTFEYPLIPEVEPVGALPTIDELNPPQGLDLSELADIGPTIELMRDVGLSV